uniref:F-box domain-containing protein n=1 Tax=Panagrellus redivivus TaxID=6233 RepID=A0A7E4VE03_PANRE
MSSLEISLNDLPYSITRRLVDLMSVETLLKFQYVNTETAFLSKRRPVTVKRKLCVTKDELLSLRTPFYVQHSVWIKIGSIVEGNRALPYFHGTYTFLHLSGVYSWRQAMRLCHPKVEDCHWYGILELNEQDYDEFIRQLCHIFATRTISIYFGQSPCFFGKLKSAVENLKRDFKVADSFKECDVFQPRDLIYITCRHL